MTHPTMDSLSSSEKSVKARPGITDILVGYLDMFKMFLKQLFVIIQRSRPRMTSDGMGLRSAKSDFILEGALTKHLMKGRGVKKRVRNHLTSYLDGPKELSGSVNWN